MCIRAIKAKEEAFLLRSLYRGCPAQNQFEYSAVVVVQLFPQCLSPPKARLLELMAGALDILELATLDQDKLASIFAERCFYQVLGLT